MVAPEEGEESPVIILKDVVLPAPLIPSKPKHWNKTKSTSSILFLHTFIIIYINWLCVYNCITSPFGIPKHMLLTATSLWDPRQYTCTHTIKLSLYTSMFKLLSLLRGGGGGWSNQILVHPYITKLWTPSPTPHLMEFGNIWVFPLKVENCKYSKVLLIYINVLGHLNILNT